jgi:hypothetical protein
MRRLLALLALATAPANAARTDIGVLPATGAAVKCLDETGLQFVVTDNRNWLLVRQGRSAFRAELVGGCPGISANRIIARVGTQGRLCRNDLINVIDPVGGMNYGQCRIGWIEPVALSRGTRF